MTPPNTWQDVIGEWIDVRDMVLVLDTNAYAQHDVLSVAQELELAAGVKGGTVLLQSIVVHDYDDNGRALDIVFTDAATALGTINAAIDADDAEAATILGTVRIVADDYDDYINGMQATKLNIGLPLKCAADSTSIWVSTVYRDATGDTYTAAGIRLKIGLMYGM